MKTFFEYFYYRMTKLNQNNSYEVPSLGLTATQFILITNIIFLFVYGPFEIKGKFNVFEITGLIVIFFGLDYYNNKLYKNRLNEFESKWANESKKEKTIGFIKIILFILLSWGLIFINAWIFGRLKTH